MQDPQVSVADALLKAYPEAAYELHGPYHMLEDSASWIFVERDHNLLNAKINL